MSIADGLCSNATYNIQYTTFIVIRDDNDDDLLKKISGVNI